MFFEIVKVWFDGINVRAESETINANKVKFISNGDEFKDRHKEALCLTGFPQDAQYTRILMDDGAFFYVVGTNDEIRNKFNSLKERTLLHG